MDCLQRQNGQWCLESLPLPSIAERYGTPCYVYSAEAIRSNARCYLNALGDNGAVFYAVKANSNLSVLRLLHDMGLGFDIVSEGELQRVQAATGTAERVLFSGVGKSDAEILRALQANILCFNLESEHEMQRLAELAEQLDVCAPVSLRVNPDVQVETHPHIATGLKDSKFGVPIEQAAKIYAWMHRSPHLKVKGISCHIGSQIFSTEPLLVALQSLLQLREQLSDLGIGIEHIDMGGGLGVADTDEHLSIENYIEPMLALCKAQGVPLCLEPGRSVIADAGILLTRVVLTKRNGERRFAITDAAMNDLIRPALYQSRHPVLAVNESGTQTQQWQVVGPVCENGDFLARDCGLKIAENDLLAIGHAGAYGFSMSSNYNSRPRSAEVLVDGADSRLIRPRERLEDLWQSELSGLDEQ